MKPAFFLLKMRFFPQIRMGTPSELFEPLKKTRQATLSCNQLPSLSRVSQFCYLTLNTIRSYFVVGMKYLGATFSQLQLGYLVLIFQFGHFGYSRGPLLQ